MTASTYHVPVLAREIGRLASGAARVVDGTVGGGGHTALLVEAGAEVLAIDRDPEAVAAARARLGPRVRFLEGRFGSDAVLREITSFRPGLVLLDLGVSSHQLDQDVRGFSFRRAVPLDMRMTAGKGVTAAQLLNRSLEPDLVTLFRTYGDEPRARKLATQIAQRRERAPFVTSDDLVNAIRATLGPRAGPPDFARLFQAVRIAVNDELDDLAQALPVLRDALVPGGALAVITYHSGEDRLVKHQFREWARACICPREQPTCTCRGKPLGATEPHKGILPSDDEIAVNPRARSARLRVFRTADAG